MQFQFWYPIVPTFASSHQYTRLQCKKKIALMNKKDRADWRLCDEFHATFGPLELTCFSRFPSVALSSGARSTTLCAISSCGSSASAECSSRSRRNRGSWNRWNSGTGERVSVCDLVGVASDIDSLEVTRESGIRRGFNNGCASIWSNGSAKGRTGTDNTRGDSHVGVDRWQDLGATDHIDVVDQTLLGRALEGHDLEVINNRLEAAIGQSLISDRNVGIVADDLVQNSFVSKLIDFGVVTDVGGVLELGGVVGETLASVLEVGHHSGVEGPVVSRCLKSCDSLLRDGLWSRSCTRDGRGYWSESRWDWQIWARVRKLR
jgi:hypothetical protein